MAHIPAAEEFLSNHKNHLIEHEEYIPRVMVEFAKLHVEKALKEASEKTEILLWQNNADIDIVANRAKYIVEDLEIGKIIKNSYSLDSIK
jgi:hypothetical protein